MDFNTLKIGDDMTDISPVGHALAAVVVQTAIGFLTGNWFTGGAFGCLWFLAREHTQAEYRWIAKFGGGKRANMPWWGGFDPKAWDRASLLDWAVPVALCTIVYSIACAIQ